MKEPIARRLLLIILLKLITQTISFKCGVDHIEKLTPKFLDVTSKNTTRKLSTTFESIRIYVDDFQFESSTTVPADIQTFTWSVLTNTTKMFEKLLQVNRLTAVLPLDITDTCGRAKISQKVANGINADLLIIPYFDSTLPSNVEAAAFYCFQQVLTYRPIVGQLLINPKFITIKPNSNRFAQMLFLHELTHVLVFHPSLYQYYKKPEGGFYGDSATITAIVNGVKRTKIATAKVIEAAKSHFGCPTADGVELENQGGEGSTNSHWESRIMLGDYMISSDYAEVVISDITFALFEDSGWYQVNKYSGGLFRFGKNQGCPFLFSKCIQQQLAISNNDYCNTPNLNRCLSGRSGRGFCYLATGLTIEASYQYFTDPTEGGYTPADYCPITYSSRDPSYDLSSNCKVGETTASMQSLGEVIGDNSVCILSSLTQSNLATNKEPLALCLPVTCSNDKLTVTIGTTQYDCPRQGGVVTDVPNYKGDLLCPDYNLICTGSTWCSDPIECVDKESTLKTVTYDYTPRSSQLNSTATVASTSSMTFRLSSALTLLGLILLL